MHPVNPWSSNTLWWTLINTDDFTHVDCYGVILQHTNTLTELRIKKLQSTTKLHFRDELARHKFNMGRYKHKWIFAIPITFYSKPHKYFHWLRKQFADKSENNLPSLAVICQVCDEWGVLPPPPSIYAPACLKPHGLNLVLWVRTTRFIHYVMFNFYLK
jgi:hypothetical protein